MTTVAHTDHPAIAGLLVMGFLGMLGAQSVHAQTHVYSTVEASAQHGDGGGIVGDKDDFFDSREGASPFGRIDARADSDHAPTQFTGFAQSWAQVDFGGVRLFTEAHTVSRLSDAPRVSAQSGALAGISDFFRLSAPGYANGALFTVTAQVRVDGSAYATTTPSWNGFFQPDQGGASVFWDSWIRVIDSGSRQNLVELRNRQDCVAFNSAGSAPRCESSGTNGIQTISFQIANNGALVQLDMRGSARSVASSNQVLTSVQADGLADLGHTMAWGGIIALKDPSGAAVTDFSAASASSSFDYRNAHISAVPEPGAAGLWLAGVAALGGLVRRRRALTADGRIEPSNALAVQKFSVV